MIKFMERRCAILVQDQTAENRKSSSTSKNPLYYLRVIIGESNHSSLPKLKW